MFLLFKILKLQLSNPYKTTFTLLPEKRAEFILPYSMNNYNEKKLLQSVIEFYCILK